MIYPCISPLCGVATPFGENQAMRSIKRRWMRRRQPYGSTCSSAAARVGGGRTARSQNRPLKELENPMRFSMTIQKTQIFFRSDSCCRFRLWIQKSGFQDVSCCDVVDTGTTAYFEVQMKTHPSRPSKESIGFWQSLTVHAKKTRLVDQTRFGTSCNILESQSNSIHSRRQMGFNGVSSTLMMGFPLS